MYGETIYAAIDIGGVVGLSPHVRGNPIVKLDSDGTVGSIPACTGKPHYQGVHIYKMQVYPRMYGETDQRTFSIRNTEGLSPHVRGNPARPPAPTRTPRSIPACTGKPPVAQPRGHRQRVYPRMYGETSIRTSQINPPKGLSPHVRGNHGRPPNHGRALWSIPACTGKPRAGAESTGPRRVYPRMYGETGGAAIFQAGVAGLSPHVRGNPSRLLRRFAPFRSIPACTGKPRRGPARRPARRVYPCMYGETLPYAGTAT